MLRLTLAQMRRSLPRLVAAGLAILLGSAFVTATLVAGDAITRGGYDAVTATYGSADIVIEPRDAMLADLLGATRDVPGVAHADPLTAGWTSFTSGRRGVSQMVVPTTSVPSLSSLEVVDGRVPTAPDEVALPATTAQRLGVGLGDTVGVTWHETTPGAGSVADDAPVTPGNDAAADDGRVTEAPVPADEEVVEEEVVEKVADVTVVGLVEDPYGAWARFGGAGLATLETVLTWTGAGTLDNAYGTVLVAVDGDVDTVLATLAQELPDADVMTRDEAAIRSVEDLGGGNVIVMLALGFAAVALLVAALVISNTFQVIVAQRTRMLALLRCVGARRGQLRSAVLLEATVLGAVTGLAGVLLGLGLAQTALSVLSRTQDGVPLPATVHPTLANVLVPVLVSVVVTVGAALVPARAATRVPPVAALRPADAPTVRARPGRVRLAFSLLLTLGGTTLLVAGVLLSRSQTVSEPMLALGIGVLGGASSFVGLLVGAPLWVPHVVSALGRPVARISTSARLAAANTVRNPRRTSATSTALVIGVTLVVMMSTGATSAQSSLAREMDERGPVDLVVLGNTGVPLGEGVADQVAAIDDVALVAETRAGTVESLVDADGRLQEFVVVDPADLDVVRDAGAVAALAEGRSVTSSWWTSGRTSVEARAGSTARVEVEVRRTDTALLTAEAAQAVGLDDAGASPALLVRLRDGADATAVQGAVQDVVANDSVQVVSAAAQRQSDEQLIDVVLAVVIGLLGVAVLIALIGVANTLSLSVIERRRESATLRAVGLSRRGLRWMLATEGMLIAGVGALIGSVLGLAYGWAGAATVFGTIGDVQLSVPWAHLGTVLVVALLAGLAASALPARTAARTPPVAALGVD